MICNLAILSCMTSLPKPPRRRWYKRWWIWLIIVLSLVTVVGVVLQRVAANLTDQSTSSSQSVTAAIRDLQRVVSTNGKITPEHSEQLAFSLGGKVSAVNVSVGDEVDEDAVLAKTEFGQQIKAPFDGRVLAVKTFVGNTVVPGTPVFEIGYRSNFVDFVASESEVFDLEAGQAVELTIPTYDNGSTTYHGVVELVDTKKTEAGVSALQTSNTESGYLVRIRPTDLPAEIDQLIGLTLNIRVVVEEQDGVLSVERAAVQYHNDDTAFVWLPSSQPDQTPVEQTVTTGFEGDDYIEITSGLSAGDTVVLNIPKAETNSVF